MNRTVKIKGKDGQEALILEESWPAYERHGGWKRLESVNAPEQKPAEEGGQPNPGQLEAGLPDKSEKK